MFENTTLRDLGLTIQLGHRDDGSQCACPIPARTDFTVIDLNGRHEVSIAFCGCDRAGEAGSIVQQLLRFDLYPATITDPNTVFTFSVIDHYHYQSLQGKISMYDYYTSLERMTDNTGTQKIRDRYKAFMRVVAQWRHLKMLQRAGRGHHPDGACGTKPGELAVRCPACPHPDINLPPDWDQVSDELKSVLICLSFGRSLMHCRYMYMLTVAIDACFRLKRRAVSSEEKDPILGSGWAYFVEDTGYREVLQNHQNEDEVSLSNCISQMV